jgi:hypothetical protein
LNQELIIQITFDEFQRWLVSGVEQFSFGEEERLAGLEPDSSDVSDLNIFIKLPEKYRAYLSQTQHMYVLSDEIEQVSLATEELTSNWKSYLNNLGEFWPFEFRSDWFTKPIMRVSIAMDDRLQSEASEQEKRQVEKVGLEVTENEQSAMSHEKESSQANHKIEVSASASDGKSSTLAKNLIPDEQEEVQVDDVKSEAVDNETTSDPSEKESIQNGRDGDVNEPASDEKLSDLSEDSQPGKQEKRRVEDVQAEAIDNQSIAESNEKDSSQKEREEEVIEPASDEKTPDLAGESQTGEQEKRRVGENKSGTADHILAANSHEEESGSNKPKEKVEEVGSSETTSDPPEALPKDNKKKESEQLSMEFDVKNESQASQDVTQEMEHE